jgi:hypothetical protein
MGTLAWKFLTGKKELSAIPFFSKSTERIHQVDKKFRQIEGSNGSSLICLEFFLMVGFTVAI